MKKTIASVILAAGFSVLHLCINPAFSQEQHNQQTTVGETELRSFAKAYLEIEKIRESYGAQLNQNPDAEKNQAIEQEAVTKIHEVINKEGLSAQTYSEIVQTANADEGLRTKLVQLIEEEKINTKNNPK